MKKLTRKGTRFNGLTLGLDLHKQFIEWCVLDRRGDEKCSGRIGSTRPPYTPTYTPRDMQAGQRRSALT